LTEKSGMTFKLSYLFIFFCLLPFRADAQSHDLARWQEIVVAARSPYTPLADKEKVAMELFAFLRKDMAQEFQAEDLKKLYQRSLSEPAVMEAAFKENKKYSKILSDFTSLNSQIMIERSVAGCADYQNIKEGMKEGAASLNSCKEGYSLRSYVVIKARNPGEIEYEQYEIPSLLYGDTLDELLKVSNTYHAQFGSEPHFPLVADIESIRQVNTHLPPNELLKVHAQMKLQDDAYQRAMLNAARNALTLDYKYGLDDWSSAKMADKVKAEVSSVCKHCNEITKRKMVEKLFKLMNEEVLSAKLTPRPAVQVVDELCQKLKNANYPFNENLSMRELSPLSYFTGKGRSKVRVTHNERSKILSQLAQQGGDGLLVLTDALTDLNDKSPGRIKLSCTTKGRTKDVELVTKATLEAKNNARQYAQKINEQFKLSSRPQEVEENLELLLRTNPRSVGEALVLNHQLAPYSCQLIAKIRQADKNQQMQDTVIIWGSAVVGTGLTLTGVLAPAGSALTMGALALGTSVGIGTGIYEYKSAQEAQEKTELYEAALFSTGDTRLINITQEEFEKYQSAKLSAMLNFGLSAVDVLVAAKTMLKAGRSIDEVSDLVRAGKIEPPPKATQALTHDDHFEVYRQAMAKKDQQAIKTLERNITEGKITKMEILDNGAEVNLGRAKYVELDNGVAGVFKTNVDELDTYQKEIAYYRLSRLMDKDVVPLTVKKEINGVEGSFQLYVKNGKAAANKEFATNQDIKMLDLMMGEIDRPNIGGNLMKLDNGVEYAIDNGRSLIGYKQKMHLEMVIEKVRTEENFLQLKKLNSTDVLNDNFKDVLTEKEILELKANINKMVTTIEQGIKLRKVNWVNP
jgi:hypothetical protein